MKAPLFCALALATATGAARAEESSLSLYGVIDAGLINQRVTGPQGVRTSHTGMVSGGLTDTLFGVRGHEDLGGGLAAKFQFESMFNLARGETSDADHFFNNAAWVGLASENLGEIRLGRQHTAAQQFASQLEAASWVNMGMGSTFRASDNYQVKNAIGYLSPAWGGVSLGLTYSFDAAGDQIKGQSSPAVSAAVQYSQGPLLLVATWDRTRLTPALRPGASNPQAVQLGRRTTSMWPSCRQPGAARVTATPGSMAATPTTWVSAWEPPISPAVDAWTPGCWARPCPWARRARCWRNGRWSSPIGTGATAAERAMVRWPRWATCTASRRAPPSTAWWAWPPDIRWRTRWCRGRARRGASWWA